MCEVIELAERLASVLSEHEFYIDYLNAKNNIDNNYQIKNLLDEYRRLQFEISLKKNTGQSVDEWKETRLTNDFAQIQAAPDAYRFLQCEDLMLNLITSIFKIINDKVPLDLDF